MMIVIYKITNPLGKIYIGQTKNYTQRLYNYSNPNSNQIGRKLYNSIKKYIISANSKHNDFLLRHDY